MGLLFRSISVNTVLYQIVSEIASFGGAAGHATNVDENPRNAAALFLSRDLDPCDQSLWLVVKKIEPSTMSTSNGIGN